MLETTNAGSLPKPEWLAEPEKLWAVWRFEGEELKRYVEEKNPVPHVLKQHCGQCGATTETTFYADPAIIASLKPDAAEEEK